MRFELKDYEVEYNKDKQEAVVYKDEIEMISVGFKKPENIFEIVAGVAICMVHNGLLKIEDIADVMDVCGIPLDAAKEEVNNIRSKGCMAENLIN